MATGPRVRDHQAECRQTVVCRRDCAPAENIIYAAQRDNLDIDGLGATLVRQLVDAGPVTDVADLFTLTREQLTGLDRVWPTSADNLLVAIERAEQQQPNRCWGSRFSAPSSSPNWSPSTSPDTSPDHQGPRQRRGLGRRPLRTRVASLPGEVDLGRG